MRLPCNSLARRALAASAAAFVLGGASPTKLVAPSTAVKAAFLSKFAAYVDWPRSAAAPPLVLCIVGRDPFGRMVDQAVIGHVLGGQTISVRHMPRIDANSGCHIAYLAGSTIQSVDSALAALRTATVLTVTDAERGPSAGMIHFEEVDRRIRFRVDQVQASAAGLTISSNLLALALSVRTKEGR